MASDNLRQVGKSLGKTAKDADRALKKQFPIKPRLERVRDVFDDSIDFEMEFVKESNDKRVLLDLFFNLPPPIRGCGVGCIHTKCEEFRFEDGGSHYVTLDHPYMPGSVSVYLNGRTLGCDEQSTSSWQGTTYGYLGDGAINDDLEYILGPDANDTTMLVVHDSTPPSVPFDIVVNNETMRVTHIEEYIEQHTPLQAAPTVWKTVAFLFKEMDYDFSEGGGGHITYTVPDADLDAAEAALLDYVDKMNLWSKGNLEIDLTIIRPVRALDSVSGIGTPRIEDIQPEIATYVPPGLYDEIFVMFSNTDGVITTHYNPWGLAEFSPGFQGYPKYLDNQYFKWVRPVDTSNDGLATRGCGFASIYYPTTFDYTKGVGYDIGFVFAHENTHSILYYYGSRLGDIPNHLIADTSLDNEEDFGYFSNEQAFLIDILGGDIVNDDEELLGLLPEMYALGSPVDPRAQYWVSRFTVTRGVKGTPTAHSIDTPIYSVETENDCIDRIGGGSALINEVNPESGEIYYQTNSTGPDVAAICYVWDDCEESLSALCQFGILPSFVGAQLVFSDRFDKTPSAETWGGKGYWYLNGVPTTVTEGTQTIPSPSNGAVTLNSTLAYVLEDFKAAGVTSEVVLAFDLTDLPSSGFGSEVNYTPRFGPTFRINSSGQIGIGVPYDYIRTDNGAFQPFVFVSQIFQADFDVRQKVFIRFFWGVDADVKVKVWPMDQPEPTVWNQFTQPLPSTVPFSIAVPGTLEWTNSDTIGGGLFITAGKLLAIAHWVGQVSSVYGYFDTPSQELNGNFSWVKTVNMEPPPTPDFVYFQSGAYTNSLTEYNTGNTNMSLTYPLFRYGFTTPFFDNPNPFITLGSEQSVLSYSVEYGKAISVKVSGQVRWAVANGYHMGQIPHLTIYIEAHKYGEGTPVIDGDVMVGNDETLILNLPVSIADSDFDIGIGSQRDRSAWTDFEIEIPVVADGYHVQWGARFQETAQQIADYMAEYGDTGSILHTNNIDIEFRRVITVETMLPDSGATPLCPDTGDIVDRCSEINEFFNLGQTFEYDCNGNGTEGFTGSNGTEWIIDTSSNPTTVEVNGSLKLLYKANGITEDGSDGRCPWNLGVLHNDTSYSNYQVDVETSTGPGQCGNSTLSGKFRIGPVAETWEISGYLDGEFGWEGLTNPQAQVDITAGSRGIRITRTATTSDLRVIASTGVEVDYYIHSEVIYNFYMEFYDAETRFKIWSEGDSEPTEWTAIQGGIPISAGTSRIFIDTSYQAFIDDNFYVEVLELSATSLQAAL